MDKKNLLTKKNCCHVSAKQLFNLMSKKINNKSFTWKSFLDIILDKGLDSSCFFSVVYPVGFWEGFRKIYGVTDKSMVWYETLDTILLRAGFRKGDDVFIDINGCLY